MLDECWIDPIFIKFLETIDQFPFENIIDLDITKETAPTIGILDKLLTEFLIPSKDLSAKYLSSNFPMVTKLLKWKLKKRIAKINRVYMSGQITAESFIKHKSYRLLLYQKMAWQNQIITAAIESLTPSYATELSIFLLSAEAIFLPF